MKKTCVLLAGILIIFIAYACEMPHSVEFKSDKFKMNAPVKIARFNLATVLTEALKDSFPEGFEVYDMVNYRGAQAFLIGYQMDLMQSFNPDDYLENLKNPDGIPPIYPDPIVIPKMTSNTISDTWFYFEMDAFFQKMEDQINDDSTPEKKVDLTVIHNNATESVTLPSELQNLPSFMVFKEGNPDDPPQDNFESAFVHKGEIELKIHLEFAGNSPPAGFENVTVTLTGIDMKGAKSGEQIGNHQDTLTATLHPDNNHSDTVTIDIDNTEIEQDDPPQFSLSGVESFYRGFSGEPETFSFKLVIRPQVKNIKLRGARALKIGSMEQPLPPEIVENIELDSVGDMLNAQIAEGHFRITATPPYSDSDKSNIPPDSTYCNGLKIGYKIYVEQDSVWLGSEEFPGFGLNTSFWDEENGPPGGDSLVDKWISGKDMVVNEQQSKITIKADPDTGVTFELFDDYAVLPYTNKLLPIKLDMGMNIDKLAVVRWKTEGANGSILPPIAIPAINFANMGEQPVSFIKEITFDEINLNVDFTVYDPPPPPPPGRKQLLPGSGLPEELRQHIALQVICSELGFELDFDENNPKILTSGMNQIHNAGEIPLNVNDSGGKVQFDVELIPVINNLPAPGSPYMEFGPVTMNDIEDNKKIIDIYAQVTVDFHWKEAVINIKEALALTESTEALMGTFPKDTEDPVDLSDMGKYMNGVTFSDNLKAKIFLSGPEVIIDAFHPQLNFEAQWGDEESPHPPLPMIEDQTLIADEVLPILPGKNSHGEWVYNGTALPEEGKGVILTGFDEIITAFPQNLRFNYEMILGGEDDEVTVYNDTFEDVEGDSKIKALMVLLLPLELIIAEEGGGFAIPSDIFGGSEDGEDRTDLFGRTAPGDSSLFTGVNIKSLGMSINFVNSMFAGSSLHFDEEDILFGPQGLNLGDGNSLNITFTDAQQRLIDENLIFPDIRFKFPPGKRVQIARNFLPVRIVIAASGSYTLNLDDLFESGN